MSSGVKECYDWGVLGCGWLGQAFARHIVSLGGTVWGSARSAASLNSIQHVGATAVPFDAQSGELPSFPPCRNLLVAWPPQVGASATKRAIEQCRTHHTVWTVCISSTSVYPDSPKVYTEGLAERRISPHSGVCVLDIEKATAGPAVSHLRAGGLLGPERPLFRNTSRNKTPDKPLNVVHLDDVIGAIVHCVDRQVSGAVNIVSPIVRSRRACRENAHTTLETTPENVQGQGGKIVSSQRILESGFVFQHPDPKHFPDLTP